MSTYHEKISNAKVGDEFLVYSASHPSDFGRGLPWWSVQKVTKVNKKRFTLSDGTQVIRESEYKGDIGNVFGFSHNKVELLDNPVCLDMNNKTLLKIESRKLRSPLVKKLRNFFALNGSAAEIKTIHIDDESLVELANLVDKIEAKLSVSPVTKA